MATKITVMLDECVTKNRINDLVDFVGKGFKDVEFHREDNIITMFSDDDVTTDDVNTYGIEKWVYTVVCTPVLAEPKPNVDFSEFVCAKDLVAQKPSMR